MILNTLNVAKVGSRPHAVTRGALRAASVLQAGKRCAREHTPPPQHGARRTASRPRSARPARGCRAQQPDHQPHTNDLDARSSLLGAAALALAVEGGAVALRRLAALPELDAAHTHDALVDGRLHAEYCLM